ncbi:MAG: HAD-IA family hydrolase [Anaerolineae bacterium]|nr:HAD-IA family hydrolase [Anaerolineae bacterium]
MTITTIFFDLHGVLIDPNQMMQRQPHAQATLLAERYGGDPDAWLDAYIAIRADWDSYWADLDLDGETPIDDLWEGELRVLRAHFRLTGTPYPPAGELAELARRRRYLVLRRFDAGYPEARPVLDALRAAGFTLGIISNAPLSHCRGALEGAGLLAYFDGRIVGSDLVGTFSKGRDTYWYGLKLAGSRPEECLVADDNADGVQGARDAGIHVVLVERPDRGDARPLDAARWAAHAVLPDLTGLPGYIGKLNSSQSVMKQSEKP